jgi:hypothetical protein
MGFWVAKGHGGKAFLEQLQSVVSARSHHMYMVRACALPNLPKEEGVFPGLGIVYAGHGLKFRISNRVQQGKNAKRARLIKAFRQRSLYFWTLLVRVVK